MRALIFAAGLGTRFKPWTDEHPKALALVNGKSLLQRNIEYLQQYGIREVIVNIHHFAEQIIRAVEENKGWGSAVAFSDEREEVLETGGGLKKAGWYFQDGPFVVINADILTDLDLGSMMEAHRAAQPLATLAVTGRVTDRNFLFSPDMELRGWRNLKTGEEKGAALTMSAPEKALLLPKAFSGVHIIEPLIFPLIKREGRFSIVDLYLDLAKGHPIRGFDHSRSRLVDVGKPESVALAESLFP